MKTANKLSSDESRYRRELDGLRSVAVLAVVLYHFKVPFLNGGFVGVDIFFVLSGFFIGGILWRQLTEMGRIDYLDFIQRRIRRLAPAYFVMVFTVSVFAYALLLPFEFRFFSKEIISSVLYFSNIIYFNDAGYFEVAAENKLLLHSWSLSVEEQFYIFLPILMALFTRRQSWLLAAVGICFILSFVANITVTQVSQTATFYLFPFRAWELLAGVLLAMFGTRWRFTWVLHPLVSWAGLGLIVFAILMTPAGKSFPGFWAIPPVLGTALVILNGRGNTGVNRMLSHPLPVFFGLISYSLYLWHWPIVTLAYYTSAEGELGIVLTLALIGLSILLAWLSWRFIETPVRTGRFSAPIVFSSWVGATTVALGMGALVFLQDGLPQRFPADVRTHIAASTGFWQDWSRCEIPKDGAFQGVSVCPIGPDGPPRLLIWGDSHVRALKEGLEQAAFEADVPALLIWHAGCPPIVGIRKTESAATQAQDSACRADVARIVNGLDDLPSAEHLLLIGRWAYYADGQGIGRDAHNTIEIMPETGDETDRSEILTNSWIKSLDLYAQHFDEIFVLRQIPEIAWYDSRVVAKGLVHGHIKTTDIPELTRISETEVDKRAAAADAIFRVPGRYRGVVNLLDSRSEFCRDDICSALQDGDSSYFDNNHITNDAARRIRHIFAPAFDISRRGKSK